jgi:excisionase family DNA binding protein
MLCVKQAAHLLHCSAWTVYELCKAGALPHIKVGRLIRLRRQSLYDWLARREAESMLPETTASGPKARTESLEERGHR